MKRGLTLLLILMLPLFSSTIVKQNIYEKADSVDIMLSFDTPYEGKITQEKKDNSTILILENSTIAKQSTKRVNSPIIQTLTLTPLDGQLYIELLGRDDFEVDASKTIDNYGLRLRIKARSSLKNDQLPLIKEKPLETKKESDISSAYLKMLLFLALFIALLYFLKKWMQNRNTKGLGGWLFSKTEEHNTIKVKQQKALDMKNRIALVEFKGKEYLLLLGQSNLLLDSFETESSKESFDTLLAQKKEDLSEFLDN